MELKEWFAKTPEYFPASFSESDAPLNHNPLIGDTKHYTVRNVRQVMKFVQHSAKQCEDNDLALSFSETWGLWMILEACCKALDFEDTHRPDGGEPDEDSEETEQAQ